MKGGDKVRLKLVEWRRARGISQPEMAKGLGISMPTYVRWEKNPGNIAISKAYDIAKILEVDIKDIIFLP